MTWNSPRTWVPLETPTAAIFNGHVRDLFLHLGGTNGILAGTDGRLSVAAHTTHANSSKVSGAQGEQAVKFRFESIANDGTANVNNALVSGIGVWMISAGGGAVALVAAPGGGSPTTLVHESPANNFSVTAGTASRTNVYVSGGNLVIQNKTNSTQSYYVVGLGL